MAAPKPLTVPLSESERGNAQDRLRRPARAAVVILYSTKRFPKYSSVTQSPLAAVSGTGDGNNFAEVVAMALPAEPERGARIIKVV